MTRRRPVQSLSPTAEQRLAEFLAGVDPSDAEPQELDEALEHHWADWFAEDDYPDDH